LKKINLPKLKIPWKLMVIGVVGICVALGSLQYQKKWVSEHKETVLVPVVEKNIPQNSIIKQDDVAMKPVKISAVDPQAERTLQDILGKVTVSPMAPGEQVRRNKITTTEYLLSLGESLVCIKTEKPESVLSGKINPGKYVNVIWLQNQNSPPQMLANRAKIVALLDDNMQPVNTADGQTQSIVTQVVPGQQKATPKYALLKVKESESYDFVRPLSGGFVSLIEVPAEQPLHQAEPRNTEQVTPPAGRPAQLQVQPEQ
jgi:Flp pilus assembly protein CpaB